MKTLNQNHITKYSWKVAIIFIILLSCSAKSFSSKLIFKGTSVSNPTDWNDLANWDLGTLPTATIDTVVIDSNRTVVIANGTQVSIQKLTLNLGAIITNHGTLTISPTTTIGSALYLNGTNIFDNEGVLNLTSENQTTVSATITLGGMGNTLIFNGTSNLAAKSANSVFVANSNSFTTISGTGFTMGNEADGSVFTPFSITSNLATVVIDKQTTLYLNIGTSRNGLYLSNTSTVINNGTITIHAGLSTSGTTLHAFNMWETSTSATSANCTFTNNGTLTIAGFQQPTVMGGTKWFTKFENTGVLNITTTSVSGALCLYSGSNLPNVILNSGTMNLNSYTNVIKLNSTSTAIDNFTNTGTINITKGTISSSATSGAILTYPILNNNQGGVININYGVTGGSTAALGTVILSNNKGGIIHGSCTFPASTLLTNEGSKLSPGDYDLVNNLSGIGIVNIVPPAAGTKFVLKGTLEVQVNGSNTTVGAAGTLYDQLKCTEIDVTAANILATVGYTPAALNEFAGVVYASISKSGPFEWGIYSPGWDVDNTNATTVGVKYTGKTAVSEIIENCKVSNYNGKLFINLDNENTIAKIDLVDLRGKILVTKEINGSLILPVNAYRGVYLLRIISGAKTQVVKLILNS